VCRPRGAELSFDRDFDGRRRAIVERVSPEIDAGRFPVKRVVGDAMRVEVDLFSDGHDKVRGVLLHRFEGEAEWSEVELQPLVNDRWFASFPLTDLGHYEYTIEAWVDPFLTWAGDLKKRIAAKSATPVDFEIGARMIEEAAGSSESSRDLLETLAKKVRAGTVAPTGLDEASLRIVLQSRERRFVTRYARVLRVMVERERARFSSWYEFFPRSTGSGGAHGTFADARRMLPYVEKLGFDVVYFPPIHPIGDKFRKGKNNSTTAEAGDVGSPWAIGSTAGGHTAIHPELGTIEDFRALRADAEGRGIEIALDIAFQASPDHPLVEQHPEYFLARPDGTIQYAENPPKKYQDIYPFHFETDAWKELWSELRDVFLYWAGEGVRIFRVDNPHTKPLPFWEWTMAEVKKAHPDVIFLSEAFTRPKIMYYLAKAGFSQSYTYFTWRNTKWDLTQYFTELTRTEVKEYFRPNAWPNTPDILPELLQHGGRGAFFARLVLAATLCSNYGIYGPAYELLVSEPKDPGGEEYGFSEKYELKQWNLDQRDTLSEVIALMNRIRRENRALQSNDTLRFHPTDNEMLICYSKQDEASGNTIVCVVNLDPGTVQSGWIDLPLEDLGVDNVQSFQAHDLLSKARYHWTGGRQFVKLDPNVTPAHILRLRRRVRSEFDFEYFL
jgi:starch synthase (maltosyl-transferring)